MATTKDKQQKPAAPAAPASTQQPTSAQQPQKQGVKPRTEETKK